MEYDGIIWDYVAYGMITCSRFNFCYNRSMIFWDATAPAAQLQSSGAWLHTGTASVAEPIPSWDAPRWGQMMIQR